MVPIKIYYFSEGCDEFEGDIVTKPFPDPTLCSLCAKIMTKTSMLTVHAGTCEN